ncbi:RNA polymerase II subunit 5-mediating protein homolog isoform X2 [Adelges cooleyi]|nr:RNA polymerase II subunit 5-mediating protein homolog isoform X2 [Adelges cooleyi]XP_050433390.1 RNA polymerase II subunit 5-mediating protein homolog isoform X2 [Adelges cooleyi]
MMPLGPRVFVRAKLCNTNEVIIRHGENIFTKQTAFQAKSVCERKIKRCSDALAAIEKEKNYLYSNMSARQEITTGATEEIIEPLDEAEEEAWRERHRLKEKEYRQKLAEAREKESKWQDDPLKRLEELELLESLKDEMIRNDIDVDSDESSTNESDDNDDDEDDEDFDNVDNNDDNEEENDAKEIEIVFSKDEPETNIKRKKLSKKKVSFNNDVQVKEFETRPEEYFIPRKDEPKIEKPEIFVTEIDDIVERESEISIENNKIPSEVEDCKDNTRPVSRFKSNRLKHRSN